MLWICYYYTTLLYIVKWESGNQKNIVSQTTHAKTRFLQRLPSVTFAVHVQNEDANKPDKEKSCIVGATAEKDE